MCYMVLDQERTSTSDWPCDADNAVTAGAKARRERRSIAKPMIRCVVQKDAGLALLDRCTWTACWMFLCVLSADLSTKLAIPQYCINEPCLTQCCDMLHELELHLNKAQRVRCLQQD
jgi:hypothetical protein